MQSWFCAALVALAPMAGAAQDAASETLLIRASKLIVRPGQERQDVAILVQRGRIVAVGEGLEAPEGAREIEGAVVCAGLVDPWTSIGVDPQAVNDPRTSASARTAHAVDFWQGEHERAEALRGGVTSARVQAGEKASVGGIGAVIRTGAEPDGDGLLHEDACVAVSIGLSRGRSAADIFDRVSEVGKITGLLDRGERYRESWLKYEKDLEEWKKTIDESMEKLEKDFKKAKKDRDKKKKEAEEKDKEFKEKKFKEDKKPKAPKFDADSEVLSRVASGELPLLVQAHRAEEIRNLLADTEDMSNLRMVLVGATEADHFADELAERDIPVVLWPTPLGASRPSEWDGHDLALAGRLERAGVRVLIGSGGLRNPRDLRLLAAIAVGHGLDREAALNAITMEPASVFDLGDRIGSVEQGKEADLLVLDGDPLDSTTQVQYVISAGRVWSE